MAAPVMIEQSRTHTAAGAFGVNGTGGGGLTVGGAITTLTNANPSVFTSTTAHGLIVNDWVQVAGVTTDTAVNGAFQVSVVGSTTTFSLPVAGNGAASFAAASASFAFPIATYTNDWTVRVRLESLTAAKNVEIAIEDSVDGVTWITRYAKNVKGEQKVGAMLDFIVLRKYDYPMLRMGTSNAVIRLNVLAIDGSATAVTSFWLEV